MKDLPSIRKELTDFVTPFDRTNIRIPLGLKRQLCEKWERAIEPDLGGVRLKTQKGDEHLTDVDLLKAAYARELTQELLDYKAKLKEHLSKFNITQKTAEELRASTTTSSVPTWWSDVKESIASDENLSEEDRNKLIRFATDNEWSGCTKGAGRGDFFISSVVNACRSNVTHNSMLGEVAKDFLELKELVDPILQWHSGSTPISEFGRNQIASLVAQFPNQSETVISYERLLNSLLAKPFTILTGASGTGKTKLAISLAKYLRNADASNYEIVAVGADWTDNRNVLGFVNYLHTDDEGPRYQSTPILDLLLRADKDPEVPYFLVLDEMNLSHVERYFADFLSAMEQKSGPLKLHSENDKLRRSGQSDADVPPELDYPDNLFVIGTVNIDETTYMFSPKVLDRANVIEFTVSEGEIAAFLAEPKAYPEIEPAEPGVAEGFLQLAKQARSVDWSPLPGEPATKISDHLLDLFKILKAERFEFAYRSAKEINIYLQVCRHLAEDKSGWDNGEWHGDLDDQILQKLLPKLHGSIGRIGKLLAKLAHYCQSGEHKSDVPTQLDAAAKLEKTDTTPFPKSLAKLQSMIGTLKEEQFVSFIQ